VWTRFLHFFSFIYFISFSFRLIFVIFLYSLGFFPGNSSFILFRLLSLYSFLGTLATILIIIGFFAFRFVCKNSFPPFPSFLFLNFSLIHLAFFLSSFLIQIRSFPSVGTFKILSFIPFLLLVVRKNSFLYLLSVLISFF